MHYAGGPVVGRTDHERGDLSLLFVSTEARRFQGEDPGEWFGRIIVMPCLMGACLTPHYPHATVRPSSSPTWQCSLLCRGGHEQLERAMVLRSAVASLSLFGR
jgi:hypothetical protein